jgi:hypothetical protein
VIGRQAVSGPVSLSPSHSVSGPVSLCADLRVLDIRSPGLEIAWKVAIK